MSFESLKSNCYYYLSINVKTTMVTKVIVDDQIALLLAASLMHGKTD